MSDYQLVIIGCGLSGLAAGIRFARFGGKVLILEKHHIPGGLNSYYYRRGTLLETGLHAMTNYAAPGDKRAPLNRLFRQLKLSRRQLVTHQQFFSEIHFLNRGRLVFSNDPAVLRQEIGEKFPAEIEAFDRLVTIIDAYDPFAIRRRISAREQLRTILRDNVLIDMLLFPLMMYGSSEENDLDFSQFVIMFRAVYQEGFFRPGGTIKELLDLLVGHYREFGGEIRFGAGVRAMESDGGRITGVRLEDGTRVTCNQVLSTMGYPNTLGILEDRGGEEVGEFVGRMSFVEYIYLLANAAKEVLIPDRTIIFYHGDSELAYCRPREAMNTDAGVICFPGNFQGLEAGVLQLRVTHPANYTCWKNADAVQYKQMKLEWGEQSRQQVSEIVGDFIPHITFTDSFTPVTIEKYTGKLEGAVYGSPRKIKDGRTHYPNLFIAGTDQGYLGIVGAMLSGVTIVNQHILNAG